MSGDYSWLNQYLVGGECLLVHAEMSPLARHRMSLWL